MERIKILFVQEKHIKQKSNIITLGDLIDNEVPDTYEMDYISVKENIDSKLGNYEPQIVLIAQSKAFDIVEMTRRIRSCCPDAVIFATLEDTIESEDVAGSLVEEGVYKCYSSSFSIDSLIHDMFVALHME